VRSGPGAASTILLFHTISARPPKQPRMVRTFLKVHTRPRLPSVFQRSMTLLVMWGSTWGCGGGRVGSRSPDGWDQIPRWAGGWVLHQPPWSFGFDSQTRGTRENRRTGGRRRGRPPDGASCSRRAGLHQCRSFVCRNVHCELPQCIVSVRMLAGGCNLGLPLSSLALPS
jgi:hypothetical protein